MNIKIFWMRIILLAVGFSLCSSFVGTGAQLIDSSSYTTDYARAEQFIPANAVASMFNISVDPNWIPNGHSSFWYLKTGRNGQEFILVDIQNKTKMPAFNPYFALTLQSIIFFAVRSE